MKYYVTNWGSCSIEAFANELVSWIGTPFRHCNRSKTSCDCIGLVMGVYSALKLIPEYKLDNYSYNWWRYAEKNPIFESLKNDMKAVIVDEPRFGDMVCFRFGKADEAHIGIVEKNGYIIHSIVDAGVIRARLNDITWVKRISKYYRMTEIEEV